MQAVTRIDRPSRVLIVSEQPVLRLGMARLFERETDFALLGEAAEASEVLWKAKSQRPDLVAIALPLNGKLHLELLRQLKAECPWLKIFVGTRLHDPSLAGLIMHNGADGCIQWEEPVATIVNAVRAVLRGHIYLGNGSPQVPLHRHNGHHRSAGGVESLTDRQLYVFTMLGQGLTTHQIAGEMSLSVRTVESYRKNIKLKLRLHNSAQLSRHAFQWWNEHS